MLRNISDTLEFTVDDHSRLRRVCQEGSATIFRTFGHKSSLVIVDISGTPIGTPPGTMITSSGFHKVEFHAGGYVRHTRLDDRKSIEGISMRVTPVNL
jgi:hypothetical protein